MTKKQIISLAIAGAIILALVIYGVFFIGEKKPIVTTEEEQKTLVEKQLEAQKYTPEIPEGVTTTTPAKSEAPASSNPQLDTKIRFFDLKATSGGFAPNSIVVKKGDGLNVDFTAVDGDYDLDIPYLGAYFSKVSRGTTKNLPFDTSLTGTFIWECRDFCPRSGKIQGTLIVLP